MGGKRKINKAESKLAVLKGNRQAPNSIFCLCAFTENHNVFIPREILKYYSVLDQPQAQYAKLDFTQPQSSGNACLQSLDVPLYTAPLRGDGTACPSHLYHWL